MKGDFFYLVIGIAFLGIATFAFGALLNFKLNEGSAFGINIGLFLGISLHFFLEYLNTRKNERQSRK